MIRAFEYLTNLAVRYPLPNPLPRGEGNRLLKIRERRIENQMAGKPENVWVWQLNPLSRGRGLGRGQAGRRLASSAKDTGLSAQ